MTRIENVRGKSAKAQYVDKDGNWLVGTTTVVDLLGPVGGLGYWGFQVGRSGEVDDYWAYLNGLAAAGTCAHVAIEAYLTGDTADLSKFTGQEIVIATACLEKFKGWAKDKKSFDLIYSERPLVSETHKYGGTLDLYLNIDGLYTILDLKSSSEIRPSFKVQTAAYRQLVLESGDRVDQRIVLALGRDPNDPLRKWVSTEADDERDWQTFLHLLHIYRLQEKKTKATTRRIASANDAA